MDEVDSCCALGKVLYQPIFEETSYRSEGENDGTCAPAQSMTLGDYKLTFTECLVEEEK